MFLFHSKSLTDQGFFPLQGQIMFPMKNSFFVVNFKFVLGGQMLYGAEKNGKIREISFLKLKVRSRHKMKVTQIRDEKSFSFVGIILDETNQKRLEKMQSELDKFYLEVTKF